jgi:hypothetical protein
LLSMCLFLSNGVHAVEAVFRTRSRQGDSRVERPTARASVPTGRQAGFDNVSISARIAQILQITDCVCGKGCGIAQRRAWKPERRAAGAAGGWLSLSCGMMRCSLLVAAGGLGVAALSLTALSGCGTSLNERTALGDPRMSVSKGDVSDLRDRTVQLPGLAADARKDAGLAQEKTGSTRLAIGKSLGREHWETTTILVPIDGVAAHPTYARWFEKTDETSRQRNEFPTAMSALELDGDGDAQSWEMLLGAPRSLGGAAAMPFRMLMHRPWKEVRHVPQTGFRASPATRQMSEREQQQLRELETPLSELTAPVTGTN